MNKPKYLTAQWVAGVSVSVVLAIMGFIATILFDKVSANTEHRYEMETVIDGMQARIDKLERGNDEFDRSTKGIQDIR